MSVPVTRVIESAALRVYDPNRRRVSAGLWLQIFNETQFELATETRCIEVDATFNITANEARYTYPADSVALKKVYYSETPSDTTTYDPLSEIFEDEWVELRRYGYPTGRPMQYFARPSFFHLMPAPATSIVDGGCVTYAVMPGWLGNEAGALVEVPDWLQVVLIDGMVARAKIALEEPSGQTALANWQGSLAAKRALVEDRSDDRRPALRTEGMRNPFQGMS